MSALAFTIFLATGAHAAGTADTWHRFLCADPDVQLTAPSTAVLELDDQWLVQGKSSAVILPKGRCVVIVSMDRPEPPKAAPKGPSI